MSVQGIGLSAGASPTTVEPINITQNGTYTAEEGTAYSPVSVNVDKLPTAKVNIYVYGTDISDGRQISIRVPYRSGNDISTQAIIIAPTTEQGTSWASVNVILPPEGGSTFLSVDTGYKPVIISGNIGPYNPRTVSVTGAGEVKIQTA